MIEKYIQAVKALLETRRETLHKGNCEDFLEYKRLVGEVRGLELALDEFRVICNESEEE